MMPVSAERVTRPALAVHGLVTPLLWGALLIALCLPIAAGWKMTGRLNDDSYITLTYVKSLVAGEGWRYNGGTEALGTTTPLFALVVALLARLLPFLTIEQVAVGFSVFCWIALGLCFALGYRAWGLKPHEGQLIGLILLLQGGYWFAALGMEATFLLAGVAGTAWLAARGYAFRSGVAAGLLFLIRPEGLAMLPLVGAWHLWKARGMRSVTLCRFAVGALIPLALWSAYAWATFGALLSNSAAAKLAQGDNWGGVTFTERLFGEWLPAHFKGYGLSPWLSVLLPLGVAGVTLALTRARALLLPLAWVTLFLAAYTALEAPPFWWYMLPVLFGIQLAVGAGWGALLRAGQPWARWGVALLLVVFLGVVTYRSANGVMTLAGDRRAESYKGLAAWLNANTPPESSVAYVEIGYLGYFGERRVVDLVGLVEPEFRENGATLDIAANFWAAEPDYLVTVEDFNWLLGEVVQAPEFEAQYTHVAELPSSFNAPLQVYAHR